MFKILVMNLGSTSSKAAIFENEVMAASTTIRHSSSEIAAFHKVLDQQDFRREAIEKWMRDEHLSFETLDCICVRGGVVKPLPGGIYGVSKEVIDDILAEKYGTHVTNVGNCIGYYWGEKYNKPVIFVDAPVTDELCVLARYSGIKSVSRRSVFHALNQKQIARQYAKDIGGDASKLNLIVAHMGGGISIGAHRKGQVIDVNNALDGEGPFSPERSGGLSCFAVLDLVEEFRGDSRQVRKLLVGGGGLVSYLGSNNVQQIMVQAQEDDEARRVIDAMIYQIAKEIGAMATVLEGKVDQILLTGGLAYNEYICKMLAERVDWICGVKVYPGEDELAALAMGALRYLNKEEEVQSYI
jgi:butyrate kinase